MEGIDSLIAYFCWELLLYAWLLTAGASMEQSVTDLFWYYSEEEVNRRWYLYSVFQLQYTLQNCISSV